MALTPTEESQTRALIAQEAPLLSLASNEATITSKLGATKVNLSQLPAATTPADADITLIRQGTTDKSVALSVLKPYFATSAPPAASETVVGVTRLATDAETLAGTLRTVAVDPGGLAAALATVSPATVQGAFKNLAISTTGTSAPVAVTCDEIVVENSSNAYKTLRAVSIAPSLATSGAANGLDTGTSAINTWYSVWVIWNGTTTAGLLSLSAAAPTMPSGYTHKARVGWIRTDASVNKYPLSFIQAGRIVQYKVAAGSNVTGLRSMASGAAGDSSTPTWVAVATAAFVPSTASKIGLTIGCVNTIVNFSVSPNNAYGGFGSAANPPYFAQAYYASSGGNVPLDMLLESSNVYWSNSGVGASLYCRGYEENF